MKLRWSGPLLLLSLAVLALPVWANPVGRVFLTGHDPDYHYIGGGNSAGAGAIITDAVNFVTQGVAIDATHKILYVTDTHNPGGDEIDGRLTLAALYGSNFAVADDGSAGGSVLNLNTVNFSNYSAIVVSSDYGSWLEQSELNILIARKNDLGAYLFSGGGLVAFAEGGDRGNGTGTTSDRYGYLPAVVSSAALNQTEVGNTVTAFGGTLGLTNGNVNGNASHNIFTGVPSGLQVVDYDSSGDILSLAGGYSQALTNPTPEPSSLALLVTGLLGFGGLVKRKLAR